MKPGAVRMTLDATADACGKVELDEVGVDVLEALGESADVVAFEIIGMQAKIRDACVRAVNDTPRPVPTKPVQPRPAPPPKDPKHTGDDVVAEAQAIVAQIMLRKGLGPALFVVRDVDQ